MTRYVAVQVSRKEYATAYLAVPDDFPLEPLMWRVNAERLLRQAVEEMPSCDWERELFGDIEAESATYVEREEAEPYRPTDITAECRKLLDKAKGA